MKVEVEVRSSGPGPRESFRSHSADPGWVVAAARRMQNSWTRMGTDHKGRTKRLCDGVAIIIRMAT